MNINRAFLIILGDIGNHYFAEMYNIIHNLGTVKKILDNVYILTIDEVRDYEEIRNTIAGDSKGYCMVISLYNLKAAWNLQPKDSEYLKSFFNDGHGEKEEK